MVRELLRGRSSAIPHNSLKEHREDESKTVYILICTVFNGVVGGVCAPKARYAEKQ